MTDTLSNEAVKTFADFDLDPRLCEALSEAGIRTPFPIQELTLPLALSGADLIGQARTGTGKTLAFGLPLLENVDTGSDATQALVIVPTRELCLQVHDDLVRAGAKKGVTVVAAYGGRAIDPQSEAIAGGAEVVVGTPGRLLDLMRRGLLNLATVATLVLDEADEMLDMGFLPDVEQLIEACAPKRQTLLFSATMPSEVVGLARRYMRKPTFMRADVEESRVAPETRQHFFAVHRMDKPALVARILRTSDRGRCVIFTRTKRMADILVKDLRDAGLQAAAIHSDLRQETREKTLARFRMGKVDVMCATEVAARGLDIEEVTHVINYDCPDDEKMYLHRIGRTGRAGAGGVAITLAIWNELARLEMIKKALDITEPTTEVFSTSELLDEEFPLPGGTGRDEGFPQRADGGDRKARTDTGEAGNDAEDTPAPAPTAERRRRRDDPDRAPRDRARQRDDAGPSDDDDPGTHRRVRRRSGPSQKPEPTRGDAGPAAPDGASTPPAGDDDAAGRDDDGDVRRRVRRRTTRRPADGSTSKDSAPRETGSRRAAATAPTGEADRAPASGPSDDRPPSKANRRRSRGRRGSGGSSSTRRREAEERPARADAAERPSPPDAATARGRGKPGLRRPLTIAHLP